MHHYFRLHFVCEPGGSRKTEYHVLGTLDEVKQTVADDLDSPDGAYHALLYGELIQLQVWEDGSRLAVIDLHPYIRYQLSDRDDWVAFPDTAGAAPLDMGEVDSDGVPFYEKLIDGTVTARAQIDWASLELPEMRGDPLPLGTDATFVDGGRARQWSYGLHGDWDHYIT